MSFAYFRENEEVPDWIEEEAIVDEEEDELTFEHRRESDLESLMSPTSLRPSRSRSSVEAPLLWRQSSGGEYIEPRKGGTVSQKIYIATEDLTAVIAGFSTSAFGYAMYLAICVLSGGLGYLLLRWLPRWRVRLIGNPEPLHKCQWTVIEVITVRPASEIVHIANKV